MKLVRSDLLSVRLPPVELPHLSYSDDMWLVDLFQGPPVSDKSTQMETSIFVVQDYISHYVICARCIPRRTGTQEMFLSIYDEILCDSVWPRYLCIGSNTVATQAGEAFIQLQGGPEPTMIVTDPNGHFHYPLDEFHRILDITEPVVTYIVNGAFDRWCQKRVDAITYAYNSRLVGSYKRFTRPDLYI